MRVPGDNGETNLATCELCYIHATTEEIAACELDPAIPALEAASNAGLQRRPPPPRRRGPQREVFLLGGGNPHRLRPPLRHCRGK